MLKTASLALAASLLIPASMSQAGSLGRPCTTEPQAKWMTLDALQGKVEALGYKVQKAKLKAACGEIYALDPNGARTELFVDPTSGDIVEKM